MAREHVDAVVKQPQWLEFPTAQKLAQALASRVATRLDEGLSKHGDATLAVSGGTTPALFFGELSQTKIDWTKVTVTLVDERFVEPQSERSNERLVMRQLLQNNASVAHFVGLRGTAGEPSLAAKDAAQILSAISQPFDVAVLGMGADGHTASWFPDDPQLGRLTDPASEEIVAAANPPGAPEPRLTLTLPAVTSARQIYIHIQGLEKKDILLKAIADGRASRLPIASAIRNATNPPQVFWTAE